MKRLIFLILVFFFGVSPVYSMTPAEEKLLFQTLGEIKGEIRQINKRLEELDKKVSTVEERLNRRIDDLRNDMNARFELIDKRFEQVDKRFEEMNKRFEQMFKFSVLLATGMFGLIGVFAGLLIWDRRTMIGETKRQVYEEMDSEIKPEKLRKLLSAFRELAKTDKKVEEILKREGLL